MNGDERRSLLNRWAVRRRDAAGDTLIEVMLALVVISLTVTAIMSAFALAISASSTHKNISALSAVMKSYAEEAIFQVQLQPSPLYTPCATTYTFTNMPTVPTGYTTTLGAIQYWNGSNFSTSCIPGSTAPQLLTVNVTGPNATTGSLSFVVSDYLYSVPAQSSPAFTSASSYTALANAPFSFTVATSGSPPPAITVKSGSLPAGVTFTANSDGTATIAGTPTATGTTTLTLSASNSVGSAVTQTFSLVVASVPTFTSAATVTWTHSQASTFTISTSGYPTSALSLTSGSLPAGVSFTDNGNGTAKIAGTLNSTKGTYTIVVTASNGTTNTTQTIVITVN